MIRFCPLKLYLEKKICLLKIIKNNDRFKIKNDIKKERYSKKVRAVKFEKKWKNKRNVSDKKKRMVFFFIKKRT